MKPCEVSGSDCSSVGPASWSGDDQVAPASVEETKPTSSWQVEVVQLELG